MGNECDLDSLCINTIRTLSVDAVEAASSGHPGAPMGMAPVGYLLWTRYLHHNPKQPAWPARDRFILSAGHASMLIYSLLHLTGYDLDLDDIKSFRQLGSKTPGHPEYGLTPGVEVTTGPLGQGISNGVGMELARRIIAAKFNKPGFDLTDYRIYVICSDGDLMEGVASEACSLAGHLGLGRLICLYDDNKITIEGSTDLAFTEDVGKRFEAYGWEVLRVGDANDLEEAAIAIEKAQASENRPHLIMIRSSIACGSPNLEGCEKSHGAPLGSEEVNLTRKNLNWPDIDFHVPGEVLEHMRSAVAKGDEREAVWVSLFENYRTEYPELAAEYERVMESKLPVGWEEELPEFSAGEKIATRNASGKVLEKIAPTVWELIGGSADLAPSNQTYVKGLGDIHKGDFSGRNLHFGVREHGMGSIMNGMARHGGLIPYGGTFLVFSDYMRPAIRMAALMKLHVVYVFTHDSLGVGEDGPTHQPVEQLAALRAIPGLTVIRPADANETVEAWKVALEADRPVALALSRQGLPVLDRDEMAGASSLARGAYVLLDTTVSPDLILIASGSEVAVAVEACTLLEADGIKTRVISMPSWELFEEQGEDYKSRIFLGGNVPRISIEAGISQGWERYVGDEGLVISIDRFGFSAPGGLALSEAGINVVNVIAGAKQLLK